MGIEEEIYYPIAEQPEWLPDIFDPERAPQNNQLFFEAQTHDMAVVTVSPSRYQLELEQPQALEVLKRFSEKYFINVYKNSDGKVDVPLHIVAASDLKSTFEIGEDKILGPEDNRSNAFISTDADGVFIDRYLVVTTWINRALKHLLDNGSAQNLEQAFSIIRDNEKFKKFSSGFDLEGVEILKEVNHMPGVSVEVMSDRRNRFLGLPWFGTPKIREFFEALGTNIPFLTGSSRRKGGNKKSMPTILDEIEYFLKKVDPNKDITVTLISDILNRNYLDNPGTFLSDTTGGEGKFLARLVNEIHELVEKKAHDGSWSHTPSIKAVYCAINEKLQMQNEKINYQEV